MRAKSNLGHKHCLECDAIIVHKITRDIKRKKFCSRSCLGSYTVKHKLPKNHIHKIRALSYTPEANAKKSHKGAAHPKYIQDRSKVKSKRPQYENSQWRKAVFERDDYTCQHCGIKGGKLQAHHILPYSTHPESRTLLDNGRTLCIECHKKTDTYGRKVVCKMRKELNNGTGS